MFNQIDNSNSLYQCLQNTESYNFYLNGKKEIILNSNKNFENIYNVLNEIFCQARIMPAFGVSLHNETINALKTDCWLEIVFNKEQTINDLKFITLLFKLEETYGINLVRKYNNQYEGRCIYLDFMEKIDLKNILLNHTNQNHLST